MIRTRYAAVLLTLPLLLTACGGEEQSQPAPEPVVTTETETETEIETVEVARMPQECAEALGAAGRVLEATAPMVEANAELAALAAQAYGAGFAEGSTGSTAETDAMVAEASRLAEQAESQSVALDAATADAEAALAACQEASN